MILHSINHCIEEEEFKLETQNFRLDEFTNSMIDSIRKSVSYCCPRCHLSFNCLEIYYHIYKCHTKEIPILCVICKVYFTHLDHWAQHNQRIHNGSILGLFYANIGQCNRQSERVSTSMSYSSAISRNKYLNSKNTYKPHALRARKSYETRSRNRQTKASNFKSKSVSESRGSSEVIDLTDSPPHQRWEAFLMNLNAIFRTLTSRPRVKTNWISIRVRTRTQF